MAKTAGNLNLSGGQLIDARAENVTSLPSFQVGADEGRLIYVTEGQDIGFWFGAFDGSPAFNRLALGTTIAQYDITDVVIADGVTDAQTVSANVTAAQIGQVVEVAVTSTTATSGQVLLEIYQATGRTATDLVYSAIFDMADPHVDRLPAYFEADNSDGDLYIDVTNNTGTGGTFSVTVKAGGMLLVQTPPPPGDGSGINAGVTGDGIAFNVTTSQLEIDLATDPGLELTGAAGFRELRVRADPSGGLQRTATGLGVDTTVVRTTVNTTVTASALVSFQDKLAILPNASAGPPVAGTHVAGEIYRDTNQNLWQCVTGGTPGDWVFFGFKEETFGGALDGTSYTASVAAGASVVLEVPTIGRRGWIRKMNIWGADAAHGAVDIDISFRIAAYPNENREGREQLWMFSGEIRKTYATLAASGGAAAVEVNDLGVLNNDDLLRMRAAAGVTEEYQRIVGRDTVNSAADLNETLVNALAINDSVMAVTELIDAPWRNNSATPGEEFKIFLEFFNEDDTQAVVFGYEILWENVGGGVAV
jgi:hypothetical protein